MAKKSKSTPKPARYEDIHFVDSSRSVWNYSLFSDEDIKNFQGGTHYSLYKLFGSHPMKVLRKEGYYFAVWAPNATMVTVVGDFNNWDTHSHPLYVRLDRSGIWEGFIPGLKEYENYKYFIKGFGGLELYKGDPFARHWETRPATSSKTKDIKYKWKDAAWMRKRNRKNSLNAPWSVYELHLGSWTKPDPNDKDSFNSYKEIGNQLVPYIKEMGFTHVEFMPVMEHPYDASWGYQGTGYYAPTSRFGTPEEFMELVDRLHQADIGVILDWVPSHFPADAHGLFMFDGTHTYEYADMRKGFHPDWNSYIFNYKRGEVRSFLISNARYWFDMYHADGMRVDAVSSILRLDYSREEGEWEPNEMGGNGNLEAIAFVQDLNAMVYRDFPDVQMIAEESTDWPGITKMTTGGGMGFGMKWMMGWMHDTLDYFSMDPLFRKDHQDKFSFSMMYFYNENFMLPLSHDEVVHGKSPMIYKMPGDEWQKFANLRVLYTYMFTHPGGKLLFMGDEFGQTSEWNFQRELDWFLLDYDIHRKLKDCVAALNNLLTSEPALYELQFLTDGFEWIDLTHYNECVVSYKRKGKKKKDDLLIVLNMTPVERMNWTVNVQGRGQWKVVFNSDSADYGGGNRFADQQPATRIVDKKTGLYEIKLSLPALSGVVLKKFNPKTPKK
ncbi:MAG: 1,4-alpha-glucan branching protein GlgB [Chitinophagaceae bacterium]|nr:1,4-alpha-glucan branching protein GlgB [Chitinophagaceae bacterium]